MLGWGRLFVFVEQWISAPLWFDFGLELRFSWAKLLDTKQPKSSTRLQSGAYIALHTLLRPRSYTTKIWNAFSPNIKNL